MIVWKTTENLWEENIHGDAIIQRVISHKDSEFYQILQLQVHFQGIVITIIFSWWSSSYCHPWERIFLMLLPNSSVEDISILMEKETLEKEHADYVLW